MAFGDWVGPATDRAGYGGQGRGQRRIRAPVPVPARRQGPAPRVHRAAFPELDCLRGRLPPAAIAAIEQRARETGVGAERVLIAAGLIPEEAYLRLFARRQGLEYEDFEQRTRRSCPLDDRQLVDAAKSGILPLIVDGRLTFVVAPRTVRQFADFMALHPQAQFRLTSSVQLNEFIATHGRAALGHKAAFAFDERWPKLSAASRCWPLRICLAVMLALTTAALVAFDGPATETFAASLSAYFLVWLSLRHLGSLLRTPRLKPIARPLRELPVYTVVAALYREAGAIDGLVKALGTLDYPGIR